MPNPKTAEMPGGDMVEPPKGKKKKEPGEMPAGEMNEPAPVTKTGAKKKGGKS